MLVPILLMSGASYFLFQRIMNTFDRVVEEALNEMVPVHELRYLLIQSAMPPNDYLIHGNKSERDEYERLSKQVDVELEKLRRTSSLMDEQRKIIKQLQVKWEENKQHARAILVTANPVGNLVLAQRMETYDEEVTALSTLLHQIDAIVHQELDEYQSQAAYEHKTLLFSHVLLLGLGILIVILASAFLAKNILVPLKILQQGTRSLGSGDLRSRIVLEADDELGSLATTFNSMADELEKLATRDELTGLLNKREFERLLDEELNRSLRYGQPMSMLMIDLDHFKSVNDQYGHPVGDKVLQIFAAFVIKQLRPSDHGVRFGGEELAIILPQTDQNNAELVAERIRTAIERNPVHIDNQTQIKLTVSIGVATCPLDSNRADLLISASDQALYAAKHAGRNRVVLFSSAVG